MIAQGIRQAIEWVFGFCGDYGVAIVAVTVVIRLLLLPLHIRQQRQMEKQQELGAELENLKRKYKNNTKKLEEEMQKLYRERGMGGTGCLPLLLQFPIMICLYNAIRLTAAAGTATVLLPWVSSLLMRDQTLALPIATLVIQFLPQTFPYLRFFKELKLSKMSVPMALSMLALNCMFVFALPSGVGLYYFVSGVFTAAEQFVYNVVRVKRCAAA